MSECRYNIPKQYRVDKGMPLEALYPRMKDSKCREIFETEIVSMEWCYHITEGGERTGYGIAASQERNFRI